MKGETGFIVSVKCKTDQSVTYSYGEEQKVLKPGEVFIGYFWQEHVRTPDGGFRDAHVKEAIIVDDAKRHFRYGADAVFPNDKVEIELLALRGPKSNTKHLPKKYQQFETWYPTASNR